MLNKNNLRELAYVVQVNEIKPIAGKDRVECAVVNGWTVMVRKDQFKVGDLGVYFEVDSRLPEKPEFAFLERVKYKIKAQKYKTPVGPFYSQGLLMGAEDLGWDAADGFIINGKDRYGVGDFLTETLGVTYADAADNERKGGTKPQDKYQRMANRLGKKAARPWFRWLMKRWWGKRVLYFIYGGAVKADLDKAFPTGRFEGVSITDQERCLPAGTKIITNKGVLKIGEIVNKKLDVKVLTLTKNGEYAYRKILDYQKFKNDDGMRTIYYPVGPHSKKTNSLCCTSDHRVLTSNGYVHCRDLIVGDNIVMPIEAYSEEVLPALYGMLLGDSHISNDRRGGKLKATATQGQKQMEYLKYKRSIFNDTSKISNAGLGSFGVVPTYHWTLKADTTVDNFIRTEWYRENRKQVTQEVCNRLTAISLAFW